MGFTIRRLSLESLECWTTWCGPCIAAIPHVDELYDKYQEKGLRVIDVNVWEDGKVILTTHPSKLTEEVVVGLLAGGDAETNALDDIKSAEQKQEVASGILREFRAAAMKSDLAGMEEAISKLKSVSPGDRYLGFMSHELLVAKKDWTATPVSLQGLTGDSMFPVLLVNTARALIQDPDAPVEARQSVVDLMAAQVEKSPDSATLHLLARLQWSLGQKEAAIDNVDRAVILAKSSNIGIPAQPLEKLAAALKQGEMPDDKVFGVWMREARPVQPAAVKE